MRISPISVLKNLFNTALPKPPVPPVISITLFSKTDIKLFVIKTSLNGIPVQLLSSTEPYPECLQDEQGSPGGLQQTGHN